MAANTEAELLRSYLSVSVEALNEFCHVFGFRLATQVGSGKPGCSWGPLRRGQLPSVGVSEPSSQEDPVEVCIEKSNQLTSDEVRDGRELGKGSSVSALPHSVCVVLSDRLVSWRDFFP